MAENPETESPTLQNLVAKSVHDMRTPLSCMRTTVEILRLTAGDAQRFEKALGMLENQVTEMGVLLDKLAKTSREIGNG